MCFCLMDNRLNNRSKITIAVKAAKIATVVDDKLKEEKISLKLSITFLNTGSNTKSNFSGNI